MGKTFGGSLQAFHKLSINFFQILLQMSVTYQNSGVNIQNGNLAVQKIKSAVQKTYNQNVLTSLGSFGSAFSLKEIINNYNEPVLVQSTDGVGTKLIIAKMMNKFDTIGQDVVANNVNDMLCMGAKPLTFLDYIGCSRLDPDQMAIIVSNMADECAKINVALVGGEMAEMPGVYVDGEVDVVGMVTGIAEKSQIVTGQNIQNGDTLVGLASSGLHTNGYSLARKVIFEIAKMSVNDTPEELNGSQIGDVLLEPHRNYTLPIHKVLEEKLEIKGMAHITGGGFIENIPRILPEGLAVEVIKNSYPVAPIFHLIQKLGEMDEREIYKTLNMGIGLVCVVSPSITQQVCDIINSFDDQQAYIIGKVTKAQENKNRVELV